jgi:hypothetical protein
MFARICKAEAYNDRQAFLSRSKGRRTSKKGLFQLMDRNRDDQLTRKEISQWYRTIDTNNDIRDSHGEVVRWVRGNLDTICASQRQKIIRRIKKEEK